MSYSRVLSTLRETKTKVINISTSFILVVMSFGAALPAMLSGTASAVGSNTIYVDSWGNDVDGCGHTNGGGSHRDQNCKTLQYAIDQAQPGDTVKLKTDLTVTHRVNINKPLTIDGNGQKVNGNAQNTSNSNDNNAILNISSDDVTVQNIYLNGNYGKNIHGINVFQSKNVTIWDVKLVNNDKSGINVNGSEVVTGNLTTSGSGWHTIDVDKAGSWLRLAGENTFNEKPGVPVIYVDDTSVGVVGQIDKPELYATRANYKVHGDMAYFVKSPAVNLTAKFQNNTANLTDGQWLNVTYKNGGSNKPVLNWDVPSYPVDHYITTEYRPDGTSEGAWNGYHNTWITAGNDAVGVKDSKLEFGKHGNGAYKYEVVAYNADNGTASAPAYFTLNYDDTTPTATIASPTSYVNTANPFTISGTFADADSGVGRLHLYITAHGTTIADTNASNSILLIVPSAQLNKNSGTFTYTLSQAEVNQISSKLGVVDGQQFDIRANVHDVANNWSNSTVTTTVDNTAPSEVRNLKFTQQQSVDRETGVGGSRLSFNQGADHDFLWDNRSGAGYFHSIGLVWDAPVKKPSNVQYKATGYFKAVGETAFTHVASLDQTTAAANPYLGNSKVGSLGDGVYKFDVVAYSPNNGLSSNPVSLDITYDATAPLASIASATQVSKDKVTFTGSVSDGNLDYYYCWLTKAGDSSEINGTHNSNCVTTPASGSTDITGVLGGFDVTGLATGNYTIHLAAVDKAGNATGNDGVGNTSNTEKYYFVVDHTAPTVTVLSPNDGEIIGGLGNDYKVTVKLKINDGAGVNLDSKYTWVAFGNGAAIKGSVAADSNKYALHHEASDPADVYTVVIDTTDFVAALHNSGTYNLTVRAQDALGNGSSHKFYTGAAHHGTKLTVDNNRTSVSLTSPANNSYQGKNFTVTGTASDFETSIDHVSIFIAHSPWSDGGYVVNNQLATYDPVAKTFSYDATNIPDGTYTVKAFAYDENGNVQSVSNAITIDTIAPNAPTDLKLTMPSGKTLIPGSNNYTNEENGVFSWSQVDDAIGYNFYPWDDNGSYFTHTIPLAPVNGSSPWTSTSIDGLWPDGEDTYHACITAVDAAGNESACSVVLTVTYDNTAPVLGDITATNNGDGTWTISGTTSDPSSLVDVSLNGSLLDHQATPDVDGNWSIITGQLTPNDYTVEATSTDGAGNTTNPAKTTSFKVEADHDVLDDNTTNPNTSRGGASENGQQSQGDGNDTSDATAGGNQATSAASDGTVEASSTNEPNSSNNQESTTTDSQSDQKSGKWLGLGWWWLVILLAIIGFFWLIAGKRRKDDDK